MVVTATEFNTNFTKYLEMLGREDIFITLNGKTVAKIIDPNISAVDSISGILSGAVDEDFDRKSLREERLKKYETDD